MSQGSGISAVKLKGADGQFTASVEREGNAYVLRVDDGTTAVLEDIQQTLHAILALLEGAT